MNNTSINTTRTKLSILDLYSSNPKDYIWDLVKEYTSYRLFIESIKFIDDCNYCDIYADVSIFRLQRCQTYFDVSIYIKINNINEIKLIINKLFVINGLNINCSWSLLFNSDAIFVCDLLYIEDVKKFIKIVSDNDNYIRMLLL